jgi:hypothetical protein
MYVERLKLFWGCSWVKILQHKVTTNICVHKWGVSVAWLLVSTLVPFCDTVSYRPPESAVKKRHSQTGICCFRYPSDSDTRYSWCVPVTMCGTHWERALSYSGSRRLACTCPALVFNRTDRKRNFRRLLSRTQFLTCAVFTSLATKRASPVFVFFLLVSCLTLETSLANPPLLPRSSAASQTTHIRL